MFSNKYHGVCHTHVHVAIEGVEEREGYQFHYLINILHSVKNYKRGGVFMIVFDLQRFATTRVIRVTRGVTRL